jgi:hypothetical protein
MDRSEHRNKSSNSIHDKEWLVHIQNYQLLKKKLLYEERNNLEIISFNK